MNDYGCPITSSNTYIQGGVFQYDLDNPVREAETNADKSVEVRSTTGPSEDTYALIDYGPSSDHALPPQLATMFRPIRVPEIAFNDGISDWVWNPSPDPGYAAGYIPFQDVTAIWVNLFEGEELHTPLHSRNLGAPFGKASAIVLYANEYSITLKFTREDSVARGYTVHLLNICTDPNLLALYRSLDNADRNSTGPGSGNTPRDLIVDYDLPGLTHGQVFGTVGYNYQVMIAVRDEGSFLDPRSKRDWWRIR